MVFCPRRGVSVSDNVFLIFLSARSAAELTGFVREPREELGEAHEDMGEAHSKGKPMDKPTWRNW
jgi:hypothetical protein